MMVSPFFEFPPSGAAQLPLFNGMAAYPSLYFAVFSKATSMTVTAMPDRAVNTKFGLQAELG